MLGLVWDCGIRGGNVLGWLFLNIWGDGGGFAGFCFGVWPFCLLKDNSFGENIGWCVRSGISSPSNGDVTFLFVLPG